MTDTPYLSIVVTARNDNHGGDMQRRMQIFVNGLLAQCKRHQLSAELVIVEWNPPEDKPPLVEALTWNLDDTPCTVRVIQVPPALHERFKYSRSLPLFQMIAKNVGIRRAQGEFVLATNIDVLFSDELVRFLAARQLRSGKMYRIDRYDVAANIPAEATLDEQLEFCQHNLLFVYARTGVFDLRRSPSPQPAEPEPVAPEPEKTGAVSQNLASRPALAPLKRLYQTLLPKPLRAALLNPMPESLKAYLIQKQLLTVQPSPPMPSAPPLAVPATDSQPEQPAPAIAEPTAHPRLHTYACGDFTLMSKQDWQAIHAYAELEMYSFHIDSVLCYTAVYAGIEEVILEEPMRMYHIEHGGGWTPDLDQELATRLAARGIPMMSLGDLQAVMDVLRLQRCGLPSVTNFLADEDWGLAQERLSETVLP